MRIVATLAISGALLLLSVGTAAADSGSITGVQGSGSTITATVNAEWSSCADFGYGYRSCGWFVTLSVQAANTDCAPSPVEPVWASALHQAPGIEAQTVRFDDYPAGDRTLCLYAYASSTGGLVALARAFYTAPAPTPIPTTGITPEAAVRSAIIARTGQIPRNLRPECATTSTATICQTSWLDRRYAWAGQFTLGGQTALFDGLRATRKCLSRYSARDCAWPVTFVTSAPSVTLPSAPTLAPTTEDFGNGQGRIGLCRDGTLSDSIGRQGACSHHGGVA